MTASPGRITTTALDLARRYAARGWRPFPIPRGTKKPTSPWGVKVASQPTDQMLALWFPRHSEWNIGLATKYSRLLVLDEDTPGELDRLCAAEGRALPATYTVHTAAGRQLYFADDEGVLGNRQDVQGYDIDVRGAGEKTGGFVVAAGSLHPDGVEYIAEDDHADVAPLPDWVREWLSRPEPGKAGPPAQSTVVDARSRFSADQFFATSDPRPDTRRFTMAQAQAYVAEQAVNRVKGAHNGTRNGELNNASFVVGHFVPKFWSYDAAARSLIELGLSVGLDADEVPATVNSGLSAGLREPYERDEPSAAPDGPATLVAQPEGEDSWTPRSRERLAEVLQGRKERAQPSVGAVRQDGARFLYPGKEHALIGEMEAGKSWWALACVAAELNAGQRVVYIHFEESDETDTVMRLADQFQVPHARILDDFLFIGPERAIDPGRVDLLCEDVAPSLVILDGQNEAMALHAQGIYEADGAAAFRQQLVKPWTRHGAAVLSLDHVVKDKERNRDGYAFGSVHKGNGLNGALLMLENTESFGEGRRGVSNLYVTKDRPGSLRKQGRPTKVPRKTFVGQMVIDAEVGTMWSFQFHTPAPSAEDSDEDARERERGARDEVAVLDALKASNARGQYPSKTDLTKGCGIGYQAAREAAARLLVAGRIVQGAPGRPSGLRVVG